MTPDELIALMPYAVELGVAIDSAAADEVRGRLDWAPQRCTAGGVMHGGALMTFADSLGAVSAYLNLPPGAATSTITSNTTLLRAVRSGTIAGRARPVHVGATIIVVQTDISDAEGRSIAQTIQTQAVRPAPGATA